LKPLENTRFYESRNNPEVTQGTLVKHNNVASKLSIHVRFMHE